MPTRGQMEASLSSHKLVYDQAQLFCILFSHFLIISSDFLAFIPVSNANVNRDCRIEQNATFHGAAKLCGSAVKITPDPGILPFSLFFSSWYYASLRCTSRPHSLTSVCICWSISWMISSISGHCSSTIWCRSKGWMGSSKDSFVTGPIRMEASF